MTGGDATRRGALVAAGATFLALRTAPASAAETDAALLEVLVAYEQETVFAYDVALANARLKPTERSALDRLRSQAAEAAAALRGVLEREGGAAPPRRAPGSEKGDPGQTTRDEFVTAIVAAEERTVGGYYVALQTIRKKRLLAGAAAFMAQGGRRLVLLRELAGQPVLPRAFETGGL